MRTARYVPFRQSPTPILFLLTAFVLSGCASDAEMAERGRRDAERDFRAGKAKLYWRGKPMDEHREYAKLLKERFGVALSFAAEHMSSQRGSYLEGYNEQIREEIAAVHGEKALEDVEREAEEQYKARVKRH